MSSFALVTEGVTDQIIIDKIISQIWPSLRGNDPFITVLQPSNDETDEDYSKGGWERLLEYCKTEIGSALATNDFVVIQIDTDAGDHANFGLELTRGGQDRPYYEILNDASAIIANAIGNDVLDGKGHQVILAICFHSLESWLCSQLFEKDHPKNAFNHLCRHTNKSFGIGLKKTVKHYRVLSKSIRKKDVISHVSDDSSYGLFLRRICQAAKCECCQSKVT